MAPLVSTGASCSRKACGSALRPSSVRPLIRTFTSSRATLAPPPEAAVHGSSTAPPPLSRAAKKPKQEGTIASVFATLSGGSLDDALPPRFADLKKSLVRSPAHAEALQAAWRDVLGSLSARVEQVAQHGEKVIPQVQYPGDAKADQPIEEWMDANVLEEIKSRGVVIVRGVVPEQQVLDWKESVREYVRKNPQTRGFPEDNPQVYELYWSKAQLAARGHPSLLRASKAFLSLFHAPSQTADASAFDTVPPPELSVSLSHPITYADRLRIRTPGDAAFALGPHVDGGGVERWEDPTFRGVWKSILEGGSEWRNHDSWSLGAGAERLGAKTDMYEGPGQCGVFRPWQGWLSMSNTGANEGTLRVLPFLKESTAYIILRPLFKPKKVDSTAGGPNYSKEYLSMDNWEFDPTTPNFPGCSLGHNIELSAVTHPHLHLLRTMTSIPRVQPGDMALWHCDVVHSVESQHRGKGDSSVMYIPAIPLTSVNWAYAREQRDAFENGVPPQDFPGGEGERNHVDRGTPADIQGDIARRAMGFQQFDKRPGMSDAEKNLIDACNAQI